MYTGRIFLAQRSSFREVLSSQPRLGDFIKAVAGTGDLWITI